MLERLRPIERDALGIWLASRVSMWVIAGATGWMFVAEGQNVAPALDRWQQWDFHHYWGIAMYGYEGDPTGVPNEAFFPGYPALLWLGHELGLRHVLAGLIVSLVAGAVAAVALGRIGELDGGTRVGRLAVLAWVTAPSAVFLAAPYTESLFLACALPAWLAARRQHWSAAGVLTALSCTVRVSGVFLAAAIAVHWLVTRRSAEADDARGRWSWAGFGWLFLPLAPLLAWSVYLEQQSGDWLAWLHAQSEGWDREFTSPWAAFDRTWQAAFGGTQSPGFAWMFRAEIVAMLIGIVLTIALVRWRRWGEATWVGLQIIAFGTSTWYFSVPRATLLWWPLWITIALLAERRRWVLWAYLAVSVPLMAVWAAAYLTSRWAG
ncbi:glycosyltransferase family 39 protein [Jiangella asiatica]|uniref:glycosyltransferase family 39 protein n=1 Tax=Jiangella asiatica TaxID=2530372 RepID=UPI00193DB286|nr:glycosyltransferase family 39 protein [Jiangella asiatica]